MFTLSTQAVQSKKKGVEDPTSTPHMSGEEGVTSAEL